jgi:hypothetical protein
LLPLLQVCVAERIVAQARCIVGHPFSIERIILFLDAEISIFVFQRRPTENNLRLCEALEDLFGIYKHVSSKKYLE